MGTDTDTDPVALRARRAIDELRRGRDELARQVATFTEIDLARPSACADWDVSQVLSHLGSAAEIGVATLEAAVAGQDPPGQEANPPIWDRWNAMSRVERSSEWAEWTERNQSAFESLDDAALGALRVNYSFFPAPIDAVALAGMRLNEQALHHWDVASTFDRDATIPESAAELLIDRMPGMMRWAGHAEKWSGGHGRISITTTAPERAWTLRIADAVEIEETQSDEPIGLTLPGETFIRLIAGRLRDADAVRVQAVGPATIADVAAMFPGF
jgi:uncharacterized protein (TIGR03083 family)